MLLITGFVVEFFSNLLKRGRLETVLDAAQTREPIAPHAGLLSSTVHQPIAMLTVENVHKCSVTSIAPTEHLTRRFHLPDHLVW